MRIISGVHRNRILKAPAGRRVRPSTDRTREGLFNILVSRTDLSTAGVLDLFAGSGALGLEAISRGAARAVFVEKSAASMRFVRDNAATLGVSHQCDFVIDDAMRFLRRYAGHPFDVVFADPPYDWSGTHDLVDAALRATAPGGLLILEHDQRHDFADHAAFTVSREYGGTTVTFFTRATD